MTPNFRSSKSRFKLFSKSATRKVLNSFNYVIALFIPQLYKDGFLQCNNRTLYSISFRELIVHILHFKYIITCFIFSSLIVYTYFYFDIFLFFFLPRPFSDLLLSNIEWEVGGGGEEVVSIPNGFASSWERGVWYMWLLIVF